MNHPIADRPAVPADICAIIVTYHPDEAFGPRLHRLLPHVGRTVVVDNHSFAAEVLMLQEACRPGATLIYNSANLGVAHALNAGVRQALAFGHSWALLLDQDSEVDADMVERLLQIQASCLEGRVAAIGARFRDTQGRPDAAIRLTARGALWEEVESVITSGCLLSLRAYAAVGPFRDEFFIDYVDTEYCLRARAAGYRIIESLTPLMSHTVGAPTSHRLFGRTVWTSNHSAERRITSPGTTPSCCVNTVLRAAVRGDGKASCAASVYARESRISRTTSSARSPPSSRAGSMPCAVAWGRGGILPNATSECGFRRIPA